jgi:outer membrane immunogenic protein
MQNLRLAALASIAIYASSGLGSAWAADLSNRTYAKGPEAKPSSWTGCYVGGNIGAGWDRFNAGEVAFAGIPTPFVDFGANTGSGLIGGVQAGCDYQTISNWVIGVQGQGEFGTIDSSNAVIAFPGVTADFKAKNFQTVAGRIGYAVVPTILAYVKGGAAWTKVSSAAEVPGGIVAETANFGMAGYTVGAGVEWMFAPGWSFFGEYAYMGFGTKNVAFLSSGIVPGFGPPSALADTAAVRLNLQTVTAGLNYRFNLAGK